MSAYRFCRTDDIALLVDALNRCWTPHVPGEPLMTPASFKRSIRDLQVWCSSCMVAFSGSDPIGVLIGAKRASATLIHTIAVHPDHLRQGHARHLLASLGSKLAILGPPRIVAEVPDTLIPACELFRTSGYVEEALLTDYVLDARNGAAGGGALDMSGDRFVIPVTVDDLVANDLLEAGDAGAGSQACWRRSVETLTARKDDIAGLAVASDERIEAYVLYAQDKSPLTLPSPEGRGFTFSDPFQERRPRNEIVSLRCFVDDEGARLKQLLARLPADGTTTRAGAFRLPKVHRAEFSKELLATLGLRPDAVYVRYAATARPD